jgi:TRAP transporter TAXI family solute receptor
VIPGGTYRGQAKDALFPSLSASLVIAQGFSEEGAYQIVKALFDHYDDLKLVHKAARHWTSAGSLKNFHVPFHDGAIRYFKEAGAWTSDHEKRQQELMRR